MACYACVLTRPPLPGQRTKCRNLEERVDVLLVEKKHLEDRLRDMKARPTVHTQPPCMCLSACLPHLRLWHKAVLNLGVSCCGACICMRSS